ncbi:Aste57867_10922 [Aphanomyces stellatus]|uniref:Aste57867_10922 protein n=1 Tax=Aphanomyces stellatus TaxID=120398 RepID=A0A485KSR4_9STRA|nr:hypothetical protein As57867_010882 [Aphanomyces stellatus]VFT87790.1 Aste57867_10922 [Aphanomyces stellatus]
MFRSAVAAFKPAAAAVRRVHTENRIKELGYTLPAVATPKGNYRNVVRSGNLLFTAGHLPQPAGGELIKGKVGEDLTAEQGYEAARHVALAVCATLKQELGDLDRVKRIVKVVGFVNCVDGFTAQPSVINGFSDTVGEIFGERGVHARSAVGTNALPLGIPVEVECIVEVEDK